MDGCKNVSISHTLPGGRYASVADSQCGQLGEFHTNLVNWTQLTVEKINSYFIPVYYKSSIKCRYLSLLCMHCVLCPPHCWCGVSMASPAIAISSDTFNCPCFVDCSSTCDTGTVTLGHCSVLWHGHVGSSMARCSSGVDTATIWSPVNLRHRAGHDQALAGHQINWMTCPRWIKMIFLAQHREWITFLNEMTFGNHLPGNLGLGSVLVDSLNIPRYWFLMAWEFLTPSCLLL